MRDSENAKIELSCNNKTFLNNKPITRSQYEEECQDLISKSIQPVKDLFKNDNSTNNPTSKYISKQSIDKVILNGGMSQTPKIIDEIRRFFGDDVEIVNSQEDDLISRGCAIQGAITNGSEDPSIKDLHIIDKYPHKLSIDFSGDGDDPIVAIPKGSEMPTTKGEKTTTNSDNQKEMFVDIFETPGGNSKNQNSPAGLIKIYDIPRDKKGMNDIEITVGVNDEGMIEASAKENNRKFILPTEIINPDSLNDEDILKLKEKVEDAKKNINAFKSSVGIDFGSGTCKYSVYSPNDAMELISIPSIVGIKGGNQKLVGNIPPSVQELKRVKIVDDMKRVLGHSFNEVSFEKMLKNFSFSIQEEENTRRPIIKQNNTSIPFEKITEMLLAHVKMSITKETNENIDDAIIAVPSLFTDSQRRAMKDSAYIAGFTNVRIISEPVATVLTINKNANAIETNKLNNEEIEQKNYVIFDMGAGKVEATIIQTNGIKGETIKNCGNLNLGGQEFDSRLSSIYYDPLDENELTPEEIEKEKQRRLRDSENAKIELSCNNKTFLNNKPITRSQYEEECQDLISKSIQPVKDLFKNDNSTNNPTSKYISKQSIDKVILNGGMSQTPKIIDEIRRFFGDDVEIVNSQEDDLISRGCAIQGAITNGSEDPSIKDLHIIDKYPHKLSIDENKRAKLPSTIIPKGSYLPYSKQSRTSTDSDNQNQMGIELFETPGGNNENEKLIQMIQIDNIPKDKKGAPKIDFTVAVNDEGILEAKAKELNRGFILPAKIIAPNNIKEKQDIDQYAEEIKSMNNIDLNDISEEEEEKKEEIIPMKEEEEIYEMSESESFDEPKMDIDDSKLSVGIDFGSKACKYCVYPFILDSKNVPKTIQSAICFKGDHRIAGNITENIIDSSEIKVISEFKRILGHTFAEKEFKNKLRIIPFQVLENNENHRPYVQHNNRNVPFEQMTGELFSKIKDDASKEAGEKIESVVVSVPTMFKDSQRKAVKNAATIAGFKYIRLINEPTAYSIAFNKYDLEKDSTLIKTTNKNNNGETKANIVFYDIGSGKVEAAIVSTTNGTISEIRKNSGNLNFGGREFDMRLVSKYFEHIPKKHNMNQEELEKTLHERLSICEKARIDLSSDEKTRLNGKTFTRNQFEAVCSDLLEYSIKPLKQLFIDGEISKNDISLVIVSGGVSQTPKIQEEIKLFFGDDMKIISKVHEHNISKGAAIYGAITKGIDDTRIKNYRSINHLHEPIGIKHKNGINSIVFKPTAVLPFSRNTLATTSEDNQSNICFDIVQGNRKMADDCITIGVVKVENIKPAKRCEPKVEVCMTVDDDGIFSVKAKNKLTGKIMPANLVSDANMEKLDVDEHQIELDDYKLYNDYVKPSVGIDLGSSKCRYAVFRKDELLKNFPAVVAFKGERLNIGNVPTNVRNSKETKIIDDMKRVVGHSFKDSEFAERSKEFTFKISQEDDTQRPIFINNENGIPFEQLTGMMFSKVKEDVSREANENVEDVVIAVPSIFSDAQRRSIRDSALIAGFKHVRLINEPSASILAINKNENDINPNEEKKHKKKNYVIFDMGAGKVEATIIQTNGIKGETIKNCGNLNLGGQEFDSRLSSIYYDPLDENELTPEEIEKEKQRRLRDSENAKIELSCNNKTFLNNKPITRSQYEEECQDLISKSIQPVKDLFKNDNSTNNPTSKYISKQSIDKVILNGGMSQTPKIIDEIRRFFGNNVEIATIDSNDPIISRGAAIQRAIENGCYDPEIRNLQYNEKYPHALSVDDVKNGKPDFLVIARDSPIPVQNNTDTTTSEDNQKDLNLDVLEDSDKLENNDINPIGYVEIKEIPDAKKGEADIDVTMGINRDGLIEASSIEQSNDVDMPTKFVNNSCLDENDVDKLKQELEEIMNRERLNSVVGIDIGTCSCRYSFYSHEKRKASMFQSVIAFKAGEKFVGAVPPNILQADKAIIATDMKRIIGRDFNDANLVKLSSQLTYKIDKDINNNRPFVRIDKEKYSYEELTSMLLSKIKKNIVREMDKEVYDIVISVPGFFPNAQRQAIRDAARISGFNVLRMVNETAATAMTYNTKEELRDKNKKNVVVFDMGGGKVDTSLIVLEDGVCTTINSAGDMNLGGRDLDYRLTSHYLTKGKKLPFNELIKDMSDSERAKIELSLRNSTTLNGTEITRQEFEETCNDLLEKTIDPLKELFVGAPITKHEVQQVILTGGCTKIPKVRELVEKFFGRDVQYIYADDLHSVVNGAAMQGAAMRCKNLEELNGVEVKNTLLLSVGISQANGINSIIIPHGTILPAEFKVCATTSYDGQNDVSFDIIQGERKMAADCIFLGHVTVDGIGVALRCVPKIEVTMKIDEDGLMSVKAKDLKTGASMTTSLYSSSNLNESDIQRMYDEAELLKTEDEKKMKIAEELGELHYGLDKAEHLLREQKLPRDMKKQARNMITEMKSWIKTNDESDPEEFIKQRNTLSNLLSTIAPSGEEDNV
ncbi:hypothetical protein TRFO_21174 [Tritrichomonas foetus]|uniref:Uncharacterized protein n=1 Tax=Tritrichomonas foetus TaxID=1144522 RepID=A0A1J4KFJ8_9EUKA|nr:hypothetical protein TRFO_21174 [Tritrichomonas foetus]|eukprot:OHT09810.1 hypothetical protein TRFO_21174 [Tritrichomonas foetus]